MKPFNRERFLLYMLAGLFTWQAALFTFGAVRCLDAGIKACPHLGEHYEKTVSLMVATTLALLGTGAMASQRTVWTSDPVSPSDESPHLLPQQPQPPFPSPDPKQASTKKARKP